MVADRAFALLFSLCSAILLGSMIEVSDRAFGGISSEAKLLWTTEKFREAILEVTSSNSDPEAGRGSGGGGGDAGGEAGYKGCGDSCDCTSSSGSPASTSSSLEKPKTVKVGDVKVKGEKLKVAGAEMKEKGRVQGPRKPRPTLAKQK